MNEFFSGSGPTDKRAEHNNRNANPEFMSELSADEKRSKDTRQNRREIRHDGHNFNTALLDPEGPHAVSRTHNQC